MLICLRDPYIISLRYTVSRNDKTAQVAASIGFVNVALRFYQRRPRGTEVIGVRHLLGQGVWMSFPLHPDSVMLISRQ